MNPSINPFVFSFLKQAQHEVANTFEETNAILTLSKKKDPDLFLIASYSTALLKKLQNINSLLREATKEKKVVK